MMGVYYCADGRYIPDGHDPEECPPCLRSMREGIRGEYHANVNTDLVARLREMDRRLAAQRRELARLNAKTAGPRPPQNVAVAFDAWCLPNLSRWDKRFAWVAFTAGWQAARRVLGLPNESEEPK